MSTLRSALRDYISMRRGLGYKFIQPEQRLGHFIAFMERRHAKDGWLRFLGQISLWVKWIRQRG
jgi:hypothetical protein